LKSDEYVILVFCIAFSINSVVLYSNFAYMDVVYVGIASLIANVVLGGERIQTTTKDCTCKTQDVGSNPMNING
jgi:hypothetical protein